MRQKFLLEPRMYDFSLEKLLRCMQFLALLLTNLQRLLTQNLLLQEVGEEKNLY